MDNLYIIIPAYNEQANIRKVIGEWHPIADIAGNESRLVVINDGSRDQTFSVASSLISTHPRLIVLDKPNSGHGPSCVFGYKYALGMQADYIFQTDSDGQTCASDFTSFWAQRNDFDFIIGYRPRREDGTSRTLVSFVLKLILFVIFRVWIKDPNTPFRLMRAEKLKPYLDKIPDDFFLSNVLISALIVKRKENLKWMKIRFKPRQGGENSINLKKIIRIGLKAVSAFHHYRRINRDFMNRPEKPHQP